MQDKFSIILEMLKRYNAGDIDLSDEEANQLAAAAFQMKQQFKTRSKPIRKGLFDLIDTATLGMVPNKWRPESPGEDLFGESGIDKFAGGVGTLGGMAVPIAGAYQLATKAPWIASTAGRVFRSSGDKIKTAVSSIKERENIRRATSNVRSFYNRNVSNPYNIDFRGINLP